MHVTVKIISYSVENLAEKKVFKEKKFEILRMSILSVGRIIYEINMIYLYHPGEQHKAIVITVAMYIRFT